MKYFLTPLLLFVQLLHCQVTFLLDDLPEDHDFTKPIYISGDFEGWTGGNDSFKLSQVDKGYTLTLSLKEGPIEFKFTQGSWESVEYDAQGNQMENRKYSVGNSPDTLFVKIASWTKSNKAEIKSTKSENVILLSNSFYIPQLNRERRISIYLPPDYHVSKEHYPVLYMHDGQNLFDQLTSYAGEWEIDETLNQLYREKNLKIIVVGIDHGEDKRLNELSPWDHPKYGKGEGNAYLDFIVNTLKPEIDDNFRTLPEKVHTGIMGSSMGGLLSHFAGINRPDVFGKVGALSPSFWYAQQCFEIDELRKNHTDQRYYFLAGGNEEKTMIPNLYKMIETMERKGIKKNNITVKTVDQGKHNESLWRASFEEIILNLFKKEIKPVRTFEAARFEKGELKVSVSDGQYHFRFYSPEIVENIFVPKGEAPMKHSHAVVATQHERMPDLIETDNSLTFSLDELSVKINKSPFQISYYYNDKRVVSEKNGYRKDDAFETIQFEIEKDEVLYGGGARALGMNRRGQRLKLYNKAHYGYETYSELMNYTLPLVLSSKKYALHFDNAPIGYLDLDSHDENSIVYETISGRKAYQLIVGKTWPKLIEHYTHLTGKQPMPPRWALGNFSSRFGYHSQEETEKTIKKFKNDSIPVDAVILDLYWFGKEIKGTMGNLSVYRDSFPDMKKMIKDFDRQGVKTILISEPFILTSSNRWEEALNEGVLAKDSIGNPATYDFYFGNTGIIDLYNPKARDWFWAIYKELTDLGVAGVWGDLGEPEVHPSWVQHATGSADEVHNIYGHDWAKLVYEGYAKDFPNQRPFILMRAGYSGSQRYGLIPWSGDVNRTWGGLQSQPEIALQMGMQGLGYMHSDLGGFAGANLDDELYTRWLQYGVFQPIYRPHAQEEVPSEPVYREEKTKQLAKKSISLRYQMLPYNYQLVFENNQQGIPLMRPLFFEENNTILDTLSTSYLWGKDFLITPITNPKDSETVVYFPKDQVWFDFYTDERVLGDGFSKVTLAETHIPTYVRAGAFIPLSEVVQNTTDYSLASFDLHYYFDETVKESKGKLYNDDGMTKQAFEKGKYEQMEFTFEREGKSVEIKFDSQTGIHYSTETKTVNFIVHHFTKAPKRIRIDGKRLKKYKYDDNTLSFPLSWDTSEDLKVKITLKKDTE